MTSVSYDLLLKYIGTNADKAFYKDNIREKREWSRDKMGNILMAHEDVRHPRKFKMK